MTLLSPKLRIGPNWIGAGRQPWRASGSRHFGRFVVVSQNMRQQDLFIAGLSETGEIYSIFLISLHWSHLRFRLATWSRSD